MNGRAGRLVLLIVFFLLAGFEIKKKILVFFLPRTIYSPRII